MIKQIVDFSRDEEARGAATIQVFMLMEEPQAHLDAIKDLLNDGAILQAVDTDTIRATYKGSNQGKLLELIGKGWTFAGQEEPPQCLCPQCKVPCDIRDTNGPELDCTDQALVIG